MAGVREREGQFAGRVAFITGAGGGIGRATALVVDGVQTLGLS